MEAARQALQDAGSRGLKLYQLLEAAGIPFKRGGGSDTQTFLMMLTRYCYIYEDGTPGRVRYYLDIERDMNFERKLFDDDFKLEDYEHR